MAYGGDPGTDEADEVRFLIGDTSTTNPWLTDDEVDYLLSEHSTPIRAAYHGALALVALFSAKANIAVGTAQLNYQSQVETMRQTAQSLADRGGAAGVSSGKSVAPWAGGRVGGQRLDGSQVGELTMFKDWTNVGTSGAAEDS